jgi:hypothetical protein
MANNAVVCSALQLAARAIEKTKAIRGSCEAEIDAALKPLKSLGTRNRTYQLIH